MEKIRETVYRALEAARTALPPAFFALWVLPAAAAMLLAYGAPLGAVLSFGAEPPLIPVSALAFCAAAWCALSPCALHISLLGLCAGCAAAGRYAGLFAAAGLLAFSLLYGAVRGVRPVKAIMKYAGLLFSCLFALALGCAVGMRRFTLGGAAVGLGISSLCVVLAVLFTQGLRALSALKRGSAASDVGILSLALLGGCACAAFGQYRLFGSGLGSALAVLCCLVAARACGLSAIACAALIASLRVFLANADMLFVAVLCVCTLCAVMLRPLGKWGVLAGFALSSIALYGFIRGTGAILPSELLLGGAAFALTDFSGAAHSVSKAHGNRAAALERELSRRNTRLFMLSDVLMEMSRLFEGEERGANAFINMQLAGVAKSLARLAASRDEGAAGCSIGIGVAECPGGGNAQTGDTACIRELNGKRLAAISDGMGMGEAARRESEQTVNMVADLVSCGFRMDEAAELINRLLLLSDGRETYATLDAMLFDGSRLSAVAAKHGAPPSYILRRGRLSALRAEALPVGIVEEAKTAVFSVKLKRGDTVIMMSDGVSDALGEELDGALKRAGEEKDPRAAARELIALARRMGGADDMTAIVARVG